MLPAVKVNSDQGFSTSTKLRHSCNTCPSDVTFVNRCKLGLIAPASSKIRSSLNGCSRSKTTEEPFLVLSSCFSRSVSVRKLPWYSKNCQNATSDHGKSDKPPGISGKSHSGRRSSPKHRSIKTGNNTDLTISRVSWPTDEDFVKLLRQWLFFNLNVFLEGFFCNFRCCPIPCRLCQTSRVFIEGYVMALDQGYPVFWSFLSPKRVKEYIVRKVRFATRTPKDKYILLMTEFKIFVFSSWQM